MGARVGDEIGDTRRRYLARVDHQRVRHDAHHRHRHEGRGIEAELRIEALVDDERRRRRRQQRVAVGLGVERRLGPDIAGGARLVLDHHRLLPFARQPVADDARHQVGGAAGRKRHDDLHRARRDSPRRRPSRRRARQPSTRRSLRRRRGGEAKPWTNRRSASGDPWLRINTAAPKVPQRCSGSRRACAVAGPAPPPHCTKSPARACPHLPRSGGRR